MITEKQKLNLIYIIDNLKDRDEWLWFKDFFPEEREYLMHIIRNQTGKRGYQLECNGTSEKPETMTKFRKLPIYWNTNPKPKPNENTDK